MESNSKDLIFFSSCGELWGGSEELWAQAAEILANDGYRVHVFKLSIDFSHPQIKRLLNLGCQITDLNEYLPSLGRRIWNRFLPYHPMRTLPYYLRKVLAKKIKQINPRLLIVSQSTDFEGLPFLKLSPLDEIPYVLIVQKATDYLWVNDGEREWMKKIWRGAEKCFFVSRHNLRLTEEKFGIELKDAEVVRNPFLTKTVEALPWTFSSADGKVRLACVARLYPADKGQDILLRVLAQDKWRERDVEVSFFGRGINEQGLKEMARFLNLNNVFFKGHVSDIDDIWRHHQALVLPSRAEGLPLALVEAMRCGRTAIVTDVGSAEVLEDNVTGFVSKSTDESGFGDAMERAWQRRSEWEDIGKLAAERVKGLVPGDPAREFAAKLINIMAGKEQTEISLVPENSF